MDLPSISTSSVDISANGKASEGGSEGVGKGGLAVPMDRAGLLVIIREQLEFYFSDDNLPRDVFLLKQIEKDKTKEGYVSLKVIAGFPKMKQLTHDLGAIREAVEQSEVVFLSGDGLSVKRKVPLVLPEDTTEKRTLYVTRLPKDCDRESLMLVFSEFGAVVRLDLPMDKKTGEHKGMAFVEYSTEEEVRKALEEFETNSAKYKMLAKPFKSKNSKDPRSPEPEDADADEEDSARKNGTKKMNSKDVKSPETKDKRTSKELKENGTKRTSKEFLVQDNRENRRSKEIPSEGRRLSEEYKNQGSKEKRSSKEGTELVKEKRSSKEGTELTKEKRSSTDIKRTSKEFKPADKEKRTSKEMKDRRGAKEFKENGTGREVPDSSYDGQNLSARPRGGSRSGRNSKEMGDWEAEPSSGRPKLLKPEDRPLFTPVRSPIGPPADSSKGFGLGRGKFIVS